MKNAVVYSINSVGENFSDSYRLRQLLYSIVNLRKFNKHIDVYVYVSDYEFVNSVDFCKSLDIKFLYFEPDEYNTGNLDYDMSKNGPKLWHRWSNTLKTLNDLKYDNVLYLDTDTIFYDDIEKLFFIYGNSDGIYTREDNCYQIMKHLDVPNNGLNAGQMMFSSSLYFSVNGLFDFMKSYIVSKLSDAKVSMTSELYAQTLWVIDQYAIYEYCRSIGLPVHTYSTKHVMLHLEPWVNTPSEIILHHYLNSNYKIAVPHDFRENTLSERFINERV